VRPTLRQLEYLVEIADRESFSRAARACGVTQPALSAQIQRLEEGLGMTLFERQPRRVVPTAAGRRVIESARHVLRAVEALVDEATLLRDPLEGTLRLGVIPTIAPHLLPRVMPAVRNAFPDLRLLLQEERTDRLTAMLDASELDLALVALESELGDLVVEPLFRDPFVLAVSREHRLASRNAVAPSDLEGEDVLLLDDGHCLRQQTSIICDAAGACELGDFRATSLGTLVQMVATGVGVTLIPRMSIEGETGFTRDVAIVPFESPGPGRTVALAWRRSTPHAERFAELGAALVPAS
jgi:LysR family hydrogen peroxide-inducible transcriptional activator